MKAGIAGALAVTLVGCSDPQDQRVADDIVVVDSVGVEIVQYSALPDRSAGIVDPDPILVIGLDETDPAFESIEDALLLPGGRLAVLDGGATQELALFDQSGELIRVFGGAGDGPGEFQDAVNLAYDSQADRVLVQDARDGRVSVFDSSGQYVRGFRDTALSFEEVYSARDGVIYAGPPLLRYYGRRHPKPWARVPLLVWDPEAAEADTLTSVDWDQSLDFGGQNVFAASGYADLVDGGLFVAVRGDRAELRWINEERGLVRITRWEPGPARRLTDSLWTDFADQWTDFATGRLPQDVIGERLASMRENASEVLPFYTDVLPGPNSSAWVATYVRQRYHRPAATGWSFLSFSSAGRYEGAVLVPPDVRKVVAVSESRIVGLIRDDLGREAVALYGLNPSN